MIPTTSQKRVHEDNHKWASSGEIHQNNLIEWGFLIIPLTLNPDFQKFLYTPSASLTETQKRENHPCDFSLVYLFCPGFLGHHLFLCVVDMLALVSIFLASLLWSFRMGAAWLSQLLNLFKKQAACNLVKETLLQCLGETV